jgi:hypothetical protein
MRWSRAGAWAELTVDFAASTLEICYSDNGIKKQLDVDGSALD